MRLDTFRHHVLALMLVSKQFVAVAAAILQPRFFEDPTEQHCCRFILEHYREYQEPPQKMALRDRGYKYFKASKHLKGQLEDFDGLLDLVCDLDEDAAKQSQYIQDRLLEFCREQALKEAILKSVDYIQEGKHDKIKPAIESALTLGAGLQDRGIYFLEDADTRETVEETRRPIATGYDFIDKPTKGGVGRGELAIIVAPPNTGKTTVLINVGAGILKNCHSVAHFSLEMQKGMIRAKYDQCFLRKTDDELSDLDEDQRNKLARWMKKTRKNLKSDLYIQDYPPHKMSIELLEAELLMLEARDGFRPDALLVDYMDLMMRPAHLKDDHLQLTWLGEELRALCIRRDIAGYTVSQTGRGAMSKETAKGDDIAGDFKKLATADFVMSFNQTEKEAEEDLARIFWMKSRLGGKYRTFNLITEFDKSLLLPA